MPKSNPALESFNAGELTPRLAARMDFSKYPAGLETCLNALPMPEGGLMRRPATRFVAELKDSGVKGRIKRFEFSTTQAYVLEFGARIMRFYRYQAQIVVGDTDAVIIDGDFPNTIADWDDRSTGAGSIALDATNYRLSLVPGGATASDIGWAEQDVAVGADFDAVEHVLKFRVLGAPSDKIELRIGTSSTGSELVADVEFEVGYHCHAFTPGDGNNTIYIQFRNLGSFRNKTVQIDDVWLIDGEAVEIDTPWPEAALFKVNGPQSADTLYLYHPDFPTHKLLRFGHSSWSLVEVAWVDGPYLDQNATTTTLLPSAATGLGINLTLSAVTGINGGQGWLSTDIGRLVRYAKVAGTDFGYAVITSITSTTVAVADVRADFAAAPDAQTTFRLGAWSGTTGYPSLGTFFQERQFVANTVTQPQTFWATQTADLENHTPDNREGTNDGTVEDDDAFDRTIAADEVETILWMSPGEKVLAIGATSGEWIPDSTGVVLTPADCVVERRTKHGSANIQPVRVGNVVLFVQRAKRKIREFGFTFEVDGFRAPDMTRLAQHVTRSTIVEMAYQQEPDSVVWGIRSDGKLISMTYRREEDIVGWARHDIGGSGSEGLTATFTITGGTAGSSNQITSITVDGAEILAAPATWAESHNFTAEWVRTIHFQYFKFPPGPDIKSINISAQNTLPVGLSFSSDGTKMYSNKSGATNKLFEYDLSTPRDADTAVHNGVVFDYGATSGFESEKVSGGDGVTITGFDDAVGHRWSPDGTKLYFCEASYSTIYEVAVPTPWSLTGATHTYGQRYRAGVVCWYMDFNHDGTRMYIFDNNADFTQHSLLIAYLITSGVSDGITFDPAAASEGDFTSGNSSFVASNGHQFFVVDQASGTADAIYQFTMTDYEDLNSAVYDRVSFNVGSQDTSPMAMFIDASGVNLYMVGRDTDTVYQWDFATPLYSLTISGGTITISPVAGSSADGKLSEVVVTTTGDMEVDPITTTMTSTGTAISESILAIPGADGTGQVQSSEDRDEVWVTVKRIINGEVKRYIEVFERDFEDGDDQEDCYYADSIITYDGDPATILSGLDHLEGETVKIWADGAVHPDRTVSGGSITLDAAYSVVQIGLPYIHTIKPLKLITGTAAGTPMGKTKQIFGVTFVLLNAHTMSFGPDGDNLRRIDFREVADLLDQGVPFFTGEHFEEWDDNWKTDPRMVIQSEDPCPFKLLALLPETETHESK